MAQIAFLPLFLGLTLGPQPIELTVDLAGRAVAEPAAGDAAAVLELAR
jgi:hypothetical protein